MTTPTVLRELTTLPPSRLGHGDIEEEGRAAPLCVETIKMLNIHVVSVSCGAEHTIALCQEGVREYRGTSW